VTDRFGLGQLVRAWRERADPGDSAGTPHQRRVPGLRREELAERAGLSVDYVVRLEQGRAIHPSPQVVAALSQALGLSADESAVLHQAAGLARPGSRIERRVPRQAARLADQLSTVPVAVYSADWWLMHWNPLWAALLGDPARTTGLDRNLVWQVFDDRTWRASPADRPLAEFRRELVADLRRLLVDRPSDPDLAGLVDALREQRASFAQLWADGGVAQHGSARKLVTHPDLGPLTLDCDVLQIPGADVHLVVYSAEPGSDAAVRLAQLSAQTVPA
jgi:transcriptional regulator with XRE-family HTH domain